MALFYFKVPGEKIFLHDNQTTKGLGLLHASQNGVMGPIVQADALYRNGSSTPSTQKQIKTKGAPNLETHHPQQ